MGGRNENSREKKRASIHKSEHHNRKPGEAKFKRRTRQHKVRRNDNRSLSKLAGDWEQNEPKLPKLWEAKPERERPVWRLDNHIAEALRRAGWNS